MDLEEAIRRVRQEIGDPEQPFRTTALSDGLTSIFDLPKQHLEPDSIQVVMINNAAETTLTEGPDYALDSFNGMVTLTSPLPVNATLTVYGDSWAMFSNEELERIVKYSSHQHCHGQRIEERYRDKFGFITYREEPKNLQNLPPLEEPLLIMLATLNTLWVLANDAATDANITTAEGTDIDRVGRYRQMMDHISDLQERYERYAGQLGVGVFRMEVLNLRRLSRTTGRLVPVFREREYDDHRWPVRELPPIDSQDEDNSGVPSPLWNSSGY
jgi:hypothetical protein